MNFPVNMRYFLLSLSIFLLSVDSQEIKKSRSPKVYLTVSSLATTPLFKDPDIRKVVINYYDADCDRMQQAFPFIALYNRDPKVNPKDALFLYKPSECPEGHISTNYTFPYHNFTKKDLVSKCLQYWVAYLEAGRIVHSNCIKTQPTWMNDMRENIGHMTINCLMIPGTHDSGLYFKYNKFRDTIFEKYMYTQEESIFNQLVYGIRFIDLRVWHEGSLMWKSKMQITHDKVHLGLPFLQEVLDDVKTFVKATNEFVILDFHRLFNGIFMSTTLFKWQHKEIIQLLKDTFGKLIIDTEYSVFELEKLWKMNKRVLITYRDELDSPEDNYVTFSVFHWWNATQKVKDLHDYLVEHACSYRDYSTAAVPVLTPTMWTPLIDATYSRRKMADEVNMLINKWFRNELSCSNVVLTDYFLGNNVIEIAIEANKNSSRCGWIMPDFGI